MKRLLRRYSLVMAFKRRRYTRGVEVGVLEGQFLETLLTELPDATIYGIDPWRNADGGLMRLQFIRTCRRVFQFGDRCRLIVAPSPQAAEFFRDDSLDFVDIDGDHSYPATLADCRAWFPKVRRGGILCGHDFAGKGSAICNQQATRGRPGVGERGVIQAVTEFAVESGLYLQTTKMRQHGEARCWYFLL